ncbi:MAG TPA: molybdopterin-dependent oxidoreductase, partial [Phenylobacterium sp.]|nr:molybdopterin-dependent oxidoreductase [Phenylobacterium sp.]
LIEADEMARAAGNPALIDHAFIADYTEGYAAFADFCRGADWGEIERESGLSVAAIAQAAAAYARSTAAIGVYGMGLTQQRFGVSNVNMVCNLMMLRGNVGREGAGLCPVRGHSNGPGQRTVGITEKPELAPLDVLKDQYGFEPPRYEGMTTVDVCERVLDGQLRAFIGLGGNFLRAAPDSPRLEAAWGGID